MWKCIVVAAVLASFSSAHAEDKAAKVRKPAQSSERVIGQLVAVELTPAMYPISSCGTNWKQDSRGSWCTIAFVTKLLNPRFVVLELPSKDFLDNYNKVSFTTDARVGAKSCKASLVIRRTADFGVGDDPIEGINIYTGCKATFAEIEPAINELLVKFQQGKFAIQGIRLN